MNIEDWSQLAPNPIMTAIVFLDTLWLTQGEGPSKKMPRKVIGYDGFVDLFRNLQKNGIAELHFGKGFTEEEEDREVRKAFQEIGEGTLDKEATRHDDPFDSFRLSMMFWN